MVYSSEPNLGNSRIIKEMGLEDPLSTLMHSDLTIAYNHIVSLHGNTPLIPLGTVHQDGYEVIIYAKMDTLNPGGSFKDRGSEWFVYDAILSGRLHNGDFIVTASAGNHAKGVAKAAQEHGLNAVIFMSDQTPSRKIEGTRDLGAKVVLIEGDYHDAAKAATLFAKEKGYMYCPAYEDTAIMIGQSTVVTESMIELHMEGIRPDFFVGPFGGGGLTNGGSLAARHYDSKNLFNVNGYAGRIYNFGVQAQRFNTAFRSYKESTERGVPVVLDYVDQGDTIADGIRVRNVSEGMLRRSLVNLDDMVDVTEQQIRDAIRRVYNSDLLARLMDLPEADLMRHYGFHPNHTHNVSELNIVEGAAAAAFAAVFAETKLPFEQIAERVHPRKKIVGVVIASGNNIDRELLEEILNEK